MDITFPDSCKKYLLCQANNDIETYFHCPVVDYMSLLADSANNILELGCGIGRGAVLLNGILSGKPDFCLTDGDTGKRQISGMNYTGDKDFYNSLSATKDYCLANGISADRLHIFDANTDWISKLPEIDFCFSIKAIGFHWPIGLYLDKIASKMKRHSYLLFEVRPDATEQQRAWNEHQRLSVNKNLFRIIGIDQSVLILQRK